MTNPLAHRYDFAYLLDVIDGNPNGDPDNDNMPRHDPETMHGLISDVALKRKIRDYVGLTRPDTPGYEIFITNQSILELKQQRAWDAVVPDAKPADRAALPKDPDLAAAITAWMCSNFFDVRTFGAVMSTSGANCGRVQGPVQLTWARSVDPITPIEIANTRMAVTTQAEADSKATNQTFGRSWIVPYGLYVGYGFINAPRAAATGFSEADFGVLLEALQFMIDQDRARSRGRLAARRLVLFKHDTPLGNAPAHRLFERIKISRTFAGDEFLPGDPRASNIPPARSIEDYVVAVQTHNMPRGVTVQDIEI